MFLSFGRKASSTKKNGTPPGSPRTRSPSGLSPVRNDGSRSIVQTVAGPLLSSTRFNTGLDASTFANVNSPGFTSRVVNCASNGNSPHHDVASHQNKYNSVGLFPRVHLGGQSTLPILSPRISQKVGRTPVRVRIAPPSFTERRRHSISGGQIDSPKDRADLLKRSPSCTQPNLVKESGTTTPKSSENISSTPDNFQETSRKRIFSESQDAWDEAKKRRRKAEIPIPNPNNDMYHYRHVRAPAMPSSPPQLGAFSQNKRAREKGSPEEQKHQKRKTSNCNNAIFSSLSSSRNLLERLTAQKRKSIDTSRSSSPIIPLSGKQLKESKTPTTDVKAIQCNMDDITQNVKLTESTKQVDTPVSSIAKRKDGIIKKGHQETRKESMINGLKKNATCDYTTKLFRKEVQPHTPRMSVAKPHEQSLWVQAPEADELTCSLLSDDVNLDRPERLKSLLACVRGKDEKSPGEKVIASTASTTQTVTGDAPISVAAIAGNNNAKMVSQSSAVTVTVSSTCTIMTSATVTSMNGVPSSESGRPPPPGPVPSSFSTPTGTMTSHSATPAASSSLTDASTSSLLGSNFGKSFTASSNATAMPGLAPSSLSPTNDERKPSSSTPNSTGLFNIDSMKLPVNSTANATGASQGAPQFSAGTATIASSVPHFGSNIASAASPSALSPASTPLFQAASQMNKTSNSNASLSLPFGPSGGNQSADANAALKPSFSMGPSAVADTCKPPSFQFASNSNGLSDMPKAQFQFGSGSSLSAHQFGSSGQASSDSSIAPKPAFQFESSSSGSSGAPKLAFPFGSSGSSAAPRPAVQGGSSGQAISDSSIAPKAAFQFESSSSGASGGPKSTFSFGSSGSSATPKPAFDMGGASTNIFSSAPKSPFQFASSSTKAPAAQTITGELGKGAQVNGGVGSSQPNFQFGQSSNASSVKPALQFGVSDPSSMSSEARKPAFQFSSNGIKPAFQFTSNSNGSSEATKSAFQFVPGTSSNTGPSETTKPAFQFTSNTGGSSDPSRPSGFQFGSSTREASRSTSFGSSGSSNTSFQFASSNSGLSETAKSGLQFSQNNNVTSPQSVNGSVDAVKSPFQFGSRLGAVSDSPKPSLQFSANSSDKVTFGSQTAGSVLGQPVSQQSKGAPSFGSAGSSFGSVTSGSATSINFGSGSSSQFGAPTTNVQTSLPSFGSFADSKPNGFGLAPSFVSSNSTPFSFNSTGTSATSSSFPSTNSSGGIGVSFGFGQKQDQAPQAFSFNASVTAVPNSSGLASQAPGFFSVGAGSSQRRTQTARRRR